MVRKMILKNLPSLPIFSLEIFAYGLYLAVSCGRGWHYTNWLRV